MYVYLSVCKYLHEFIVPEHVRIFIDLKYLYFCAYRCMYAGYLINLNLFILIKKNLSNYLLIHRGNCVGANKEA